MILDADAEAIRAGFIAARLPRLETLPVAAARTLLAEMHARNGAEKQHVDSVTDISCPGAAGQIPLRLYRMDGGQEPRPCMVFYHGGGWVLNSLDLHDALCRAMAVASGCAILSVDYRLAPEHVFPAALDDAVAAFRFAATHADELGIDGQRLAVGGDSAGGNLASVVAIMARNGDIPAIRLQILLYPVLDLSLSQPSHAIDGAGFAVTGATMRWFRDLYLGTQPVSQDWRHSPLMTLSLTGVAPCHLVTAGADPLCDEGLAFAARLAACGNRLTHEHHPGQMHGFLTAGITLSTARRSLATIAARLRAELVD